jgi:hypothetical protein
MDAAVAETVAKATRQQAEQDARTDLTQLGRLAVEAGRDRSRKIIKTSRIDVRTGDIRYNPAGRLLRDWYFHVYMNMLRANLGAPAETVDAQQVEDTAALLHLVHPQTAPLSALQAVGLLRCVAIDDAAHAATMIVAQLAEVGGRRAVLHAGNDRFDGDQVRIHVIRHWYQRCYDDRVHAATRSQQPLTNVTDAEERQVALTLESRQIKRLIGRDGIPLITPQSTLTTDVDRRLAAGEAGVVSPVTDVSHHTDAFLALRSRVIRTWSDLTQSGRVQWLRIAGVAPGEALGWSHLQGDDQGKIIRLYLETHRRGLLPAPFDPPAIATPPEIAARRMFNHRLSLTQSASSGDATTTGRETSAVALEPVPLAIAETNIRHVGHP